ncbi:MAG TPA: GAF domain-containing sensor histidine kinase [Roseiflexaceae bacterium]|nr:GAF domain-containing sensor histidine kinase [Roseiflexaceae bacterium]
MLAALADISTSHFGNPAELTATFLATIQRLLGVRGALITQLVDGMITIGASYSTDWELPPGKGFALEGSFCQYVQTSRAPLIIGDTLHDSRVKNIAMQKELGIRAYLGVPIYTHDGLFYGTVCAVDRLPRTFSQAQIDLLRIVAGHIASAVERQDSTRAALQAEQDMQSVLQTLDERSTMLRVVAHDMRTPLSSISGFVELLQQYALGPVSSAQQEALSRIKLASVFITRLAEDLIDALTIETQPLALLPEALDPCLIATNVLELCRPLAVARGLALELRSAGDLPRVVGDPERLQQVLFNLLSNALRYTEQGQVALVVDSSREMVEFRVEDTGPGIPKDRQEQIWKPYTRATTAGQGLGLGLYVVQRLTLAMGGSVGMRSIEGQGSAFWVRLPRQARVQAVGDSLED